LCFMPSARADSRSFAQGSWIGGFDLGERRIPYILRIAGDADVLSTTVDRIDRIAAPQAAISAFADGDSLHVSFGGGGEDPWSFVLATKPDRLEGILRMNRRGQILEIPSSFVPMKDLSAGTLDALAGEYEDGGGERLVVSHDANGILIAYRRSTQQSRMLFPTEANTFISGTGPTRAEPTAIRAVFRNDWLEWTTDDVMFEFRRVEAESTEVTLEGTTLKHGQLSLPLIRIPSGSFEMGQHKTVPEIAQALELELPEDPKDWPMLDPLRTTTISSPFLMSQFELSNSWFAVFVEETGYMSDAERAGYGLQWTGDGFERVPGMMWRDPGFDAPDDAPVVHVSWNDASAFCSWLDGKLEGAVVRLPTEAEWEYACAAGSATLFSFGDGLDSLDDYAWSTRNAEGPKPVGRKRPNAWGLYDMHGNVWEWCADGHAPIDSQPATDPVGPIVGAPKILRGGSWINGPWSLRTAYRGHDTATLAEPHFGFRIVIEGM